MALTARQLAAHTAGMRHYAGKDYRGSLAGAPRFASVGESLAIFSGDPLLSAVVEGAAGKPYLDVVEELVTRPLGLLATGADHPYRVIPNRGRFSVSSEK